MGHLSRRPKALLTALQAMTFMVAGFGTWLAWLLGTLGLIVTREDLFNPAVPVGAKIFILGALATVVVVSVCCYITLGSFFAMLQRMKEETAFTRRNCKALGRMALSCAIAAAALLLIMGYIAVGNLVPGNFTSRNFWASVEVVGTMMAWPFGFGLVALLIQGVRVLMIRAMDLQEQQELVV